MIKTTLAVLIAATALSAAAPAYADTNSVFGNGSDDMRDMLADSVVLDLRAKGINATEVEEWGGLIRAFVTSENGAQTMQLFTPGTLTQVNL